MRLVDADETIEHIKTRLHETALNNATVNCDASYLYTECADNRIKTWIDEMPTIDTSDAYVRGYNAGVQMSIKLFLSLGGEDDESF